MQPRPPRRRRPSGLTLIETLVVVAIIGLVAAALIFFLMPSDDRRARMEAERLAAWLTEISAAAVMNDAPARAVFDFTEQKAHRELAEVGAAVASLKWQRDDRGRDFTVRKPVRITAVINAGTGEVSGGMAWLLFNARRTPGGVVILELNEAVYSVIVPRGDGEIRVEPGRKQLPDRPPGFVRNGRFGEPPSVAIDPLDPGGFPTLPPGTGPSGDSTGDGLDPTDPDEPPDLDAGPPKPPDAGPPDYDAGGPSDDVDDVVDEEPPDTVDAGAEEDAETEPDAGPECESDVDCPDLHACDMRPGEMKCVISPRNRTFRVYQMAIIEPQDANNLFDGTMRAAINGLKLNLMIRLANPAAGVPGPEQPYVVQLFSAVHNGQDFALAYDLPTTTARAEPAPCGLGGNGAVGFCFQINLNAQGGLTFWLKKSEYAPTECAYNRITVRGQFFMNFAVNPNASPGTEVGNAEFSANGGVTEADADKWLLEEDTNESLADTLNGSEIPKNFDFNGDGDGDGWRFAFSASASVVPFNADPSGNEGVLPPNCE